MPAQLSKVTKSPGLAGEFKILKSVEVGMSSVVKLNQVDKYKTRGFVVKVYRKCSGANWLKGFRLVRYVEGFNLTINLFLTFSSI